MKKWQSISPHPAPLEREVPLQDPRKLDELLTAMENLHNDLPKFLGAVSRAWKGTIAALVVGVAAFVVGLGAIGVAVENRNNVTTLEEVKQDNVVAVCNLLNESIITNIRAGLVDSIKVLAKDPNSLTEREQAILDAYTVQVAEEFPLLDCSEEGIESLVEEYTR